MKNNNTETNKNRGMNTEAARSETTELTYAELEKIVGGITYTYSTAPTVLSVVGRRLTLAASR